jgi:ankyrin repeat protein
MRSPRSPLLGLPNELLCEVGSYLESFEDLNSLVRTSRFFHTLFNNLLYRRAVDTEPTVRENIVGWVLGNHQVVSLTLLLENGLSIDQKLFLEIPSPYEGDMVVDMLRCLCFHWEEEEDVVPLARLLIERGADIVATDKDGQTVLHVAARRDYPLTALLLEHGADVNATDVHGITPLHAASQENSDGNIVKLLVAQGAVVNARDEDGYTPLHVASFNGNKAAVKELLEHGAAINARVTIGEYTPLRLAGFRRKNPAVPLLVERRADGGSLGGNESGWVPGGMRKYLSTPHLQLALMKWQLDLLN